jgi:hypothetical protein
MPTVELFESFGVTLDVQKIVVSRFLLQGSTRLRKYHVIALGDAQCNCANDVDQGHCTERARKEMVLDMLISSPGSIGISTAAVARWARHQLEETCGKLYPNCSQHQEDKVVFVEMRNAYEHEINTFENFEEFALFLSLRKVLVRPCFSRQLTGAGRIIVSISSNGRTSFQNRSHPPIIDNQSF